jgi:hypothetical protein
MSVFRIAVARALLPANCFLEARPTVENDSFGCSDLPGGRNCRLVADASMIRIQFGGTWTDYAKASC